MDIPKEVDALSWFPKEVWGRGEDDRLNEALFDTPRKSFTLPTKERFELPSVESVADGFGSLSFLFDFLFELFMLDR